MNNYASVFSIQLKYFQTYSHIQGIKAINKQIIKEKQQQQQQ